MEPCSPPVSEEWPPTQAQLRSPLERSASEELLPLAAAKAQISGLEQARGTTPLNRASEPPQLAPSALKRSQSPPPLSTTDAVNRAISLSQRLSGSNIPSHVTETGDLMLDMHGYKSSDDDALRAEVIARKILSEELEGSYDIGALIGADEHGNLWIYSSEESKEAAARKAGPQALAPVAVINDAASDPGYHTDEDRSPTPPKAPVPAPAQVPANGLVTPPRTPSDAQTTGDPNRNYAKTLRLTSEQLKELNLKPGANPISFSVNRATCQANMHYWKCDVPVVISDIDGTITKYECAFRQTVTILTSLQVGRTWARP